MARFKLTDNIQEKILRLKNFIKYGASNKGISLTILLKNLNEKYGTTPDVSNFSAKFKRGTLPIAQLYQIMDELGYDIEFVERK